MSHDLGVGLAGEFCALLFQHLPELAKILDDAVVNDGHVFGGMRMGVVLGWLAMGRPPRVSDAGMTGERFGFQPRFKIFEFALGAAAFEMIALEGRNASRIIAAIFEALERIPQLLRNRPTPKNADNAAHAGQYLPIKRVRACISYRKSAGPRYSIIIAD